MTLLKQKQDAMNNHSRALFLEYKGEGRKWYLTMKFSARGMVGTG